MPWTADDAPDHNPDLAGLPELCEEWASVANAALEEGLSEGEAISRANASVEDAIDEYSEEADRAAPHKPDKPPFLRVRDASVGVPLVVAPNSYNAKTRTCDVMLSTGASVRRRDFMGGDEFDEVLEMQPQSIRLERLNRGAQFLDAHQYHRGLDALLGGIIPGSARIERGGLWAKLKLSRNRGGENIARNLADGIVVPVSVGYRTHREVTNANTSPMTRTAVDWEPYEVSYAPIPHEAGASIRSVGSQSQGGTIMSTKTTLTEDEQKRAAEQAAAEAAERKRADDEAGALALAKRAREDAAKYTEEMFSIGAQAKFENTVILEAVRGNVTLDDFRKRAVEALAEETRSKTTSSVHQRNDGDDDNAVFFNEHGRIVVGQNRETLQRSDAMFEALHTRMHSAHRQPVIQTDAQAEWAKRLGREDPAVVAAMIADGKRKPRFERTTQYLGMGLSQMAAICMGYRGSILTPEQGYELQMRAFHSTSDFQVLLEGVVNKTLLDFYSLHLPTYRELSLEQRFSDFRPHNLYRQGDHPTLQPITEAGEIKAATMGESKEIAKISSYGIMMPFTRQLLINDDMNTINRMLSRYGIAVANFENEAFYAMFNSNPVLLTDGLPVFHLTHGNLSATGREPAVVSISDGRKAVRSFKTLDNQVINQAPSIILAGPAHETRIEQLTAAVSATFQGNVNPFANRLRPIFEGLITGNEWYLFVNPTMVNNYVHAFLTGAAGPRTASEEPFTVQGVRFKVEHDFGVGAVDYRGAYKDTGAAPTELLLNVHVANAAEIGV